MQLIAWPWQTAYNLSCTGAQEQDNDPTALDSAIAELDLQNYDDDDEMGEQQEVARGVFGSGNPGMTFYRSNLEDPYIVLPGREAASDSEEEAAELQSTDYVIVSARHEEDVSLLEVGQLQPDPQADSANPSSPCPSCCQLMPIMMTLHVPASRVSRSNCSQQQQGPSSSSAFVHTAALLCLQVWVYEDDMGEPDDREPGANLYVHHDIMLPAVPLCLAWLDCVPSGEEHGNLVAVGSMEPGIELWALDVMDAVEPLATLGGRLGPAVPADAAEDGAPTKKKKKVRAGQAASGCCDPFLQGQAASCNP